MKNITFYLIASLILGSSAIYSQHEVSNEDREAIEAVVANMERGWNSKDGKVFSDAFAENHDYIVWTGLYFPMMNKEQNAMSHQQLFDGPYKDMYLRLVVDNIRMIRSDLARVHFIGGSKMGKDSPFPKDPTNIFSTVMEKKDGEWKIISFHNLDIKYEKLSFEPISDEEQKQRIKQMFSSWYEKS